ncbi:S9 family peptidase [Empedobacter stercoris]|uniref:S9 family peptidase n=1 Tax=Empedobacter TaxID=59734 RepID=UPI0021AFE220|nr:MULTISPECIES: S9 family peptidase [Empedobacter]MDM1523180.1 S9 family peptidase [Empedobacter sp. 225-1]MDM1543092.1 S9 family peptidase [Empedobacter sp. 189-2]UWX65958.1 S9 family peptidase [Empedobacter stercoris]
MKKFILSLAVLAMGAYSYAQQITLEGIYGGKYRESSLFGVNSLNDGENYTILTKDGLVKRSYESTLKKGQSSDVVVVPGKFEGYEFSSDERYVLLQTETKGIYRHSFTAKFEVYDTQTKSKVVVFDGKKIQEPLFSPDASKVAFAFENNLYIQDLKTNKVTQVTTDGKKNNIINGINDWVYEEEFGFVRNFDWNADGTSLAYVRFDESKVKEINIPIYHNNLYPQELRYKYPKAGQDNSEVSLHVFDTKNNSTANVNLDGVQNYYIPKIKFSSKANLLTVVTSNRHQNNVDVSFYDINTKKVNKLFTETNKAWIETDNLTVEFLADNSFLWTSERDGNNHIYHYADNGKLINQITKGEWEVTNYYGYNPANKTLYYQSNSNNGKRISTERQISSVSLDGKKTTMLTKNNGTNSAAFSKNFTYFINTFSSITTPRTISLVDSKSGKDLGVIVDNTSVKEKLNADNIGTKELFVLKTAAGNELNAYVIKPKDFDANKKYPVLMYQYSGPGSQNVNNSYFNSNDYWHMMLAQEGYIVFCVDGRGTGYKGEAFKKQTYLQLGKYEVEDQIAAAKEIGKLPYVDNSRIGIWGWSYGGFMASNVLFKGNDVFKAAIAVAPVTNWRYYDTVYTERFMRTPQENASGYDDNSPINYANDLKGNFLLISGSADDNVHAQNTYELSEALVQANKDFDMAIYTDKDHGIYGGNTRVQLYRKMTNFIKKNL